ncbi:MAG: hypothetical protein ACRDQB_08175 [Thermocrispum sp.]
MLSTYLAVRGALLAHPDVLPAIDLAEWDTALDDITERTRRACLAVTLVVSVLGLWSLGPWWPAPALLA